MSKFELKDRLDRSIYKAFNCLSSLQYAMDFKTRNLIRQNAAFKDRHEGERCFILGTGPSLNSLSQEEQDRLQGEVLFGVNSYYRAPISARLVPKYYALTDELYRGEWSPVFGEVAKRFSDAPPTFIIDPRAKVIVEKLELGKPPIYVHAKKYPTDRVIDDLTSNTYVTMNVVSTCILVASYLGFKEICLLGCDYNAFCSAGRGHCYDDQGELDGFSYSLAFFLKFYWITTEFHYLISQFANKKGIKVINVTPGSLLDAYPRLPLNSVL